MIFAPRLKTLLSEAPSNFPSELLAFYDFQHHPSELKVLMPDISTQEGDPDRPVGQPHKPQMKTVLHVTLAKVKAVSDHECTCHKVAQCNRQRKM